MSASNTYVFMTEVLPRAIKKHGGIDAEALRKAALEVDLPEGGTMLGFGVKFEGEGSPMAGQNERAFPVIVQYVDDKPNIVWPKSLQQPRAGAAAAGLVAVRGEVSTRSGQASPASGARPRRP